MIMLAALCLVFFTILLVLSTDGKEWPSLVTSFMGWLACLVGLIKLAAGAQ